MKCIAVMMLLTGAPACAQDAPKPPSEDLKTFVLKQAYQLNGNSMVRWGCIDMSGPTPKDCPMTGPPEPKLDQKKQQ